MHQPPDLTQDEIDGICFPLKQAAAQVRFLKGLGLHVDRRPDGSPLVNRAHYDAVRGRQVATTADDGPQWGVH